MRVEFLFISLFLLACKNGGYKERADADFTAVPAAAEYAPKKVWRQGTVQVEVYDYKGFEKFLKANDDKNYVFNFWATWCKPCVEELPHFERLHKTYKDKQLEVILVSLDIPNTIEKQLLPFIASRNIQARVIVLDDPHQNDWIPKVSANWSGAIPATLLYRQGKKAFFEQSFEYEELEKRVLTFLNPL